MTKLQPSFQRAHVNEQKEGCYYPMETGLRGSVKVPRGETAKLLALWLLCLTISSSTQPIHGGYVPTFIGLSLGAPIPLSRESPP